MGAQHIAFYKGILFLKIPFMKADAASFGVVFLGEEVDLREDAIYALILEEECGWINGLKTVMDRVF